MYKNRNQQKTEHDHMFYVFRRTKGEARDHLYTRQGTDSYDLFLDIADIFEFLKQIYTNPNKVREAKDIYADLRQGLTLFPEFRVQFLKLAIKGHIPHLEFKDDLYQKLNPRIREILLGSVRRLTYKELCEYTLDVDNEVRINQKLAKAKKEVRVPSVSQTQKPCILTPGILPIQQSLLLVLDRQRLLVTVPPDQKQWSLTIKNKDTCHNCSKTGHWANECPEAPKHHIYKINKLYLQVIEVDTDNKEASEALQPENSDA